MCVIQRLNTKYKAKITRPHTVSQTLPHPTLRLTIIISQLFPRSIEMSKNSKKCPS